MIVDVLGVVLTFCLFDGLEKVV